MCYVKLSRKRPDFEKTKPAPRCRDSNTIFAPADDNSVHVNEKSLICKICDTEFFIPSDLKHHLKNCELDLSSDENQLKHIDDHRDGGNWAGGAGVPPNLGSGNHTLAMLNATTENELLVGLEQNMLHFTALTLDTDPQNLDISGLEPVLGSDLPSPPKKELRSVKKKTLSQIK